MAFLFSTCVFAGDRLPTHDELREQLQSVVDPKIAGGIGLDYWGVVVDRDGVVRSVAFSGENRNSPLAIGRVIAAIKAGTANSLSNNKFVISTPQLYTGVRPRGLFQSLDVLPINQLALKGPVELYGTRADPMIGHTIGGASTLGGGLALYNSKGEHIGAIGIGGQHVPCADHNAGWIIRHQLALDFLPVGIGFSPTGDDNIVFDVNNKGVSASGFGTIECSPETTEIGLSLPVNYPLRR